MGRLASVEGHGFFHCSQHLSESRILQWRLDRHDWHQDVNPIQFKFPDILLWNVGAGIFLLLWAQVGPLKPAKLYGLQWSYLFDGCALTLSNTSQVQASIHTSVQKRKDLQRTCTISYLIIFHPAPKLLTSSWIKIPIQFVLRQYPVRKPLQRPPPKQMRLVRPSNPGGTTRKALCVNIMWIFRLKVGSQIICKVNDYHQQSDKM